MEYKVKKLIEKSKSIVILLSHADADSLASGIILKRTLNKDHRKVVAVHYESVADKFDYVPYINEVSVDNPVFMDFSPYDLIITVDASNLHVLIDFKYRNEFRLPFDIPVLCIDHHISNSRYASHYIYDPSASSTTEIIYRNFLKGIKLNKDEATLVLMGIVDDTGSYKWNTNEATHNISAELIKSGADIDYITNFFEFNKPLDLHHFLTYFLPKIQFYPDIECMFLEIPQSDMKRIGYEYPRIRELNSLFKEKLVPMYEGYNWGGCLVEMEDGSISGGFKGNGFKNKVDISVLYELIPNAVGGGHFNAGGFVAGGISMVECKVLLLENVKKKYYSHKK